MCQFEAGRICELETGVVVRRGRTMTMMVVGMKGRSIPMALLSLVSLILESVWITFCPRGRGRMGRDTRTRICTVLVVAHADVAKPNGIRRVLLAVGRYFITPTHQRRLRVSSSMRRKTTSTSYLQPYASLVALARLVMHLAHPLLHTPVYRPNKPT